MCLPSCVVTCPLGVFPAKCQIYGDEPSLDGCPVAEGELESMVTGNMFTGLRMYYEKVISQPIVFTPCVETQYVCKTAVRRAPSGGERRDGGGRTGILCVVCCPLRCLKSKNRTRSYMLRFWPPCTSENLSAAETPVPLAHGKEGRQASTPDGPPNVP